MTNDNTQLLNHARRTIIQLEATARRRWSNGLTSAEKDILTSAYNVLNVPDADRQVLGTDSKRQLSPLPKTSETDAFGVEVKVGDTVIAMRGYQSKRLAKAKVVRLTECFFIVQFAGETYQTRRPFKRVSKVA